MTFRRRDLLGPALCNLLELRRGDRPVDFAHYFVRLPQDVQVAAFAQLSAAAPAVDAVARYIRRLERELEYRRASTLTLTVEREEPGA